MTKKGTNINPELFPEEQQLEEEIINHIDKAEIAHIVESLPVPVNNPSVHSDFFSTLDKHQVYDRLEKIFLAIKNEKKETLELGLLLKKYDLQSGNLS